MPFRLEALESRILPSFGPPSLYAVGSQAQFVAVGDFNHDGKQDLAVSNSGNGTVGVLLGKGNGSFQPQVTYPTGSDPIGIVVSDFNGDGKQDLAVANAVSCSISILLGNGDGSFQPAIDYFFGISDNPDAVVAGDFNRDGKQDLAVVLPHDHAVAILLGHGDGTFAPQMSTAAYYRFEDGTGTAMTDSVDGLSDGTQNAMYSTDVPVNPVPGTGSSNQFAVQFDGTSAATVNSQDFIFDPAYGNATLEFWLKVPDQVHSSVFWTGEDDNDTNRFNLFVSGTGSGSPFPGLTLGLDYREPNGTLHPLMGYGLPGETPFTLTPNVWTHVAIVREGNTYTSYENGVKVFSVSDANPNLPTSTTWTLSGRSTARLTGLIDEIRFSDAALNPDQFLDAPAPALPGTYDVGSYTEGLAAADVNGDGYLDLVAGCAQNVSVLLGRGDGTFQPAVAYPVGNRVVAVAIADFNRDGKPDIAAGAYNDHTINILLGNGDGTFHAPVSQPIDASVGYTLAVGDYDGDRKPDIATVDNSTNEVSILFGNGDGSLQPPVTYQAGGQYPIAIAAGDFNRDGAPDLVAADNLSASVSVLLNQPEATHFAIATPTSSTAGTPFAITVTALTNFGTIGKTYTGTVHLTSTDGMASLPADYTFTGADAGKHTLSGLILRAAGGRLVIVTDSSNKRITGSKNLTVLPADAVYFNVSSPLSSTAGNAFTVVVVALDPFGNRATSYLGTIHFSSSDSQATLPADYPFTSADRGRHTFTAGATLRTAGSQIIRVQDVASSLAGSISVTVRPGSATHLSVAAPTTVTAGADFTFTVVALDAFGNQATGYRGTVQFTSSDPATADLPIPYTFNSHDAGKHIFHGVFNRLGFDYLTATDTVNGSITGMQTDILVVAPTSPADPWGQLPDRSWSTDEILAMAETRYLLVPDPIVHEWWR
jgi:hypothetical protein